MISIVGIYPLGTMNVCSTFRANPLKKLGGKAWKLTDDRHSKCTRLTENPSRVWQTEKGAEKTKIENKMGGIQRRYAAVIM